MPLSFMKAISASRGIRRNRLPGTRKPFKPPAVEAADDRLLRDLADLRRLAGGENRLHKFLATHLHTPSRMAYEKA